MTCRNAEGDGAAEADGTVTPTVTAASETAAAAHRKAFGRENRLRKTRT
jgi:hypothetical protein